MINFNFVASRPMKIESTCIEIIDRKKGKERSISIRKIGNNVFDIYIYIYKLVYRKMAFIRNRSYFAP